ncbi:hypothetical protein ACIQWQ_03235 [Peribacillus frigoritolerans]
MPGVEIKILHRLKNCGQKDFYLLKHVPVDWNVRYETPAGKASPGETPQARGAEEASRTARGKRVPEVEINVVMKVMLGAKWFLNII